MSMSNTVREPRERWRIDRIRVASAARNNSWDLVLLGGHVVRLTIDIFVDVGLILHLSGPGPQTTPKAVT